MPIARYFVERLTAHSDVWMVKLDDEEHGPYKSQSEAVRFAIDAAEKLNKHGEKAQVVIIGPTWTLRPGHQPRGVVSCAGGL
jgi:hypothetical protein